MDRLEKPDLPGVFLELKSRTWSAQDAERKAELIGELLELVRVQERDLFKQEYLGLAAKANG